MKRILSALFLTAGVAVITPPAAAQVAPTGCGDCASAVGVACGSCDGCRNGSGCNGYGGVRAAGCVGCPTPGACTADGVCYPKVRTWGHYQGQWKPWPGDLDDPIPQRGFGGAADRGLPGINQPIPAPVEDLQAPPSSDADEDEDDTAADEEGAGAGVSLPPLPPPRRLGAPPVGSGGADPPPSLPPLPGFDRPLQPPTPGTPDGFSRNRGDRSAIRNAVATSSGDLPPVLPAGFTKILQGGANAKRGSAVSAGYMAPAERSVVVPKPAGRSPVLRRLPETR
ncbi:MAG: hypothetical protein AAGB00_07220 [Planctomycetota bacterium]